MRFGGRRSFGDRDSSRGGSFGGGRRFQENDYDTPKPVKVGEEYDVEINEVGSKGDGIARVKNFVVFINGVKQGEKVHIKITDVRNRFAVGEKTGPATGNVEGKSEAKEEAPQTQEGEGNGEGEPKPEGGGEPKPEGGGEPKPEGGGEPKPEPEPEGDGESGEKEQE